MAKYVVAKTQDIPDGDHMVVEVNGRSVGIFHIDGEWYGLLNRCPHRGGPMCEGLIVSHLESERPGEIKLDSSRKLLECPWHGWEFDLRTGQSFLDPVKTRIRPYPVTVQSGAVVAAELEDEPVSGTHMIPGPYMAETFEVSIKDEYVVVSMR